MLQPFDHVADSIQSKHKFMVQTAIVPEGETSLDTIVCIQNLIRLRSRVIGVKLSLLERLMCFQFKKTTSNELMDSKLRVVFDNPEQNEVHQISLATSDRTNALLSNRAVCLFV